MIALIFSSSDWETAIHPTHDRTCSSRAGERLSRIGALRRREPALQYQGTLPRQMHRRRPAHLRLSLQEPRPVRLIPGHQSLASRRLRPRDPALRHFLAVTGRDPARADVNQRSRQLPREPSRARLRSGPPETSGSHFADPCGERGCTVASLSAQATSKKGNRWACK